MNQECLDSRGDAEISQETTLSDRDGGIAEIEARLPTRGLNQTAKDRRVRSPNIHRREPAAPKRM